MKRESFFFMLVLLLAGAGFAQKMTVKDSDSNVLMEVNDEGTVGSITMPSGVAPSPTTNKLYNVDGALYWNGTALGTSGSAGGWTDDGANVYTTTSTDNVGIGTSSPEFKLSLDDDGGILAKGTYQIGTTLATTGAGTRLIWYPKKAAFRAGLVMGTQWNDANVGNYSVAISKNTKASGFYSTAMGCETTASGTGATAMGCETTASGMYSTAMGNATMASSYSSTAMGQYNVGGGTADSWIATDPLFEIGNSTQSGNRNNAVTVLKNGNVGILNATPGNLLTMEASGGGYYNATTHTWVDGSTRAIKQDISPNSMDLQKVLDQVDVVNYRYKTEVAENPNAPYHIGFIADDTPELLSGTNHDGVQTTDCIGLLLAVVKEQQKEIESLKTEMKELRR